MYTRNFSHILVGVIYHPRPDACDLTITNHIITFIDDTIKSIHTLVLCSSVILTIRMTPN